MSTATLLAIFDIVTKVVTSLSILISVPVYVSTLWFINANGKKAPFNSPFYSCFTALGIIDLCCYWLYMIKKFQFWGWTIPLLMPADQPNLACSLVYFLIWFTGMAQWQLNILISVNRFVSLMFPDIYKKYWSLTLNRCYILVLFFICFVTTSRIIWLPTLIQTTTVIGDTENITKFTGPVFLYDSAKNFYNTIWKAHIYIILGICFFCYIPMFVKIRRLNLTNKSVKLQHEISMLYTLTSLLVVNLLYMTFMLARDYLVDHYKEFGQYSNWFLYILADVYDLHNPYNLLVTSKRVRWGTFPCCLFRHKFNKPTPLSNQMNNCNQHGGAEANNQNIVGAQQNVGGVPGTTTQTFHST